MREEEALPTPRAYAPPIAAQQSLASATPTPPAVESPKKTSKKKTTNDAAKPRKKKKKKAAAATPVAGVLIADLDDDAQPQFAAYSPLDKPAAEGVKTKKRAKRRTKSKASADIVLADAEQAIAAMGDLGGGYCEAANNGRLVVVSGARARRRLHAMLAELFDQTRGGGERARRALASAPQRSSGNNSAARNRRPRGK